MSIRSHIPHQPYGAAASWRSLALVTAAHIAVLAVLLSLKPVAEAVGLPQPLMVSLLTSEPAPTVEPPKPVPPKPQVQETPQIPPPVLVTRSEAPAANAPPPAPAPVPEVLPAPPPVPVPVKPVAVAVAAPPAPPPPVIPPRFDADYLDNPAPVYPPLSRRLGEQGRVLLGVLVSAEGGAMQVEVRESSGHARLDKAARDTVARWRFVPARQGDKGVSAWVQVPISFSLRS